MDTVLAQLRTMSIIRWAKKRMRPWSLERDQVEANLTQNLREWNRLEKEEMGMRQKSARRQIRTIKWIKAGRRIRAMRRINMRLPLWPVQLKMTKMTLSAICPWISYSKSCVIWICSTWSGARGCGITNFEPLKPKWNLSFLTELP